MYDIRSYYYGHQPSFRTSGSYESPLAFRLIHKHRILSQSNRSIRAKSENPYEPRPFYRHRPIRHEFEEPYLKLITSNTYRPMFTQRLRPRVIQESNNVKLTCTVDGRPTPSVSWFKGRTPVAGSSARYTVRYQHGMCTLEISNCVPADSGDYVCKASNSSGSDETSATLFIESTRKSRPEALQQDSYDSPPSEIPERRRSSFSDRGERASRVKREIIFEPQIIQGLQEITVYENTAALLQCRIEGKPFPEVEWFRNGELISGGGRIEMSVNDNEVKLLIKVVKKDDAGEYECRITNKAGSASTTAEIIVKDGIPVESTEEQAPIPEGTYEEEHVEKVAEDNVVSATTDSSEIADSLPVFVKQLKSLNLNEADEMMLTCELVVPEGEEVSVEWTRNNQLIPENPDFIRSSEKGLHSLQVHEMFPEDSGVFGASATNSNGTRTSLCTVIVHEENAEKVFDVLDFPTSTNVTVGQSIHLECVIGGTEEDIEGIWYVNDVQITDDIAGFRTERTEKGSGAQRFAIYIDEAIEAIHEGAYKLELIRGDKKLVLCASVHVQ